MRRDLTILHTSDVHVGSHDQRSSAERWRCLRAFGAVIDRAIAERVDLVLVAGDLFDHFRIADDVVAAVASHLARLPVPAVILPGNHDPVAAENSAYARMHVPENVRVVSARVGETFRFPRLGVEVWGRPHMTYEEDLRPLLDTPPPGGSPWRIAIAHGHYVRDKNDLHRSYLIHPEHIAGSRRDYVALGHWDLRQSVGDGTVPAYYPGSPTYQGMSSIVELRDGEGGRRVEVSAITL